MLEIYIWISFEAILFITSVFFIIIIIIHSKTCDVTFKGLLFLFFLMRERGLVLTPYDKKAR